MQPRQTAHVIVSPQVPGYHLALYRMVLGLVMLKEAHRIALSIHPFYIEPDIQIPWPFLEWWPMLPEFMMHLFVGMIALGGLMVTLGLWSKIGSALGLVAYSYFFFLDRSYYNNHYYLILLNLFLLTFIHADKAWSLRHLILKTDHLVPAWNIAILRFQLALVYFVGATAKFNNDWMSGRTIRASLQSDAYQNLKQLFAQHTEQLVLLLTHGGWIFDLFVPLLLLHKKGRYWALPFIIIFHVINMFSLNIGVFPYMMLAATVIFFGEGWRDAFQKATFKSPSSSTIKQTTTAVFIWAYIILQFLLPLRHHLIPGDYNITGEGYCFSWKMKGNAIELLRYEMFGYRSDTKAEVSAPLSLHPKQFATLSSSPTTNITVAKHLAQKISLSESIPIDKLDFFVYLQVSINGNQPIYIIDTTKNILKASYSSLYHSDIFFHE
jgi:vitamin K-dependent gamma-carboxylase